MKDKIIGIIKSKVLFAFAINLVIVALCVLATSFSYDSVDDFYNSLHICNYHNYYNNNINYILATIIGSTQYILNGFNCYVLALIGFSFIAFTSITYVFVDKYSRTKAVVFTLLVNILFALDHYAHVHSAKTSALLIAGGFLLVLNAIRNKRYNLPFFIGVIEILFGSFFMFEYFFVGLAFAVAFFMGDMIAKRKYKIAFRKFFWYFRPFLLVFAFVVASTMLLNQYTYSVNNSSYESSDFYEYSMLTDSVSKFPFPNYKDNQAELAEAGISSESEYELLKDGYYDKNTSLNIEALGVINDIQKKNYPVNIPTIISNIAADYGEHFLIFDSFAFYIIVFVFLTVVYIIYQKRRFAFFPVFYLPVAFASGIYIRILYSGASYYVYGIYLFMVVMLLNSFDFGNKRPVDFKLFSKRKISLISCSVFLVCLLGGYASSYIAHHMNSKNYNRPSGLLLEISIHPERYYLLDPVTANDYIKNTDYYNHPLWGYPTNFMKNIDSFGYYHDTQQLRRFSLTDNPYKSAIDSRKVFVIDNYMVFKKEKYFTKYYASNDKTISYALTDEHDGYKIYKVVSK